MEIKIDLRKKFYENINDLYNIIKELKEKKNRIFEKIKEIEDQINNINLDIKVEEKKMERKKRWYEKFRWTFTYNNFLLIAGKDSITNEILIRKYLEKNDLVFHAEIHGSPFGILKNGINAKKEDLEDSAQFVGSYSRAWKLKIYSIDVYYVKPEQISKKVSGLYLPRGSFMIYGEKNYIKVELKLSIGIKDYELIVSTPRTIENFTNKYVTIIPGDKKPLDIAKEISKKLSYNNIDDIVKLLPGPSDIL